MAVALSGQIEHITYTHLETGFTIARVKVAEERELVTVVGQPAASPSSLDPRAIIIDQRISGQGGEPAGRPVAPVGPGTVRRYDAAPDPSPSRLLPPRQRTHADQPGIDGPE